MPTLMQKYCSFGKRSDNEESDEETDDDSSNNNNETEANHESKRALLMARVGKRFLHAARVG